MLAHFKKLNTPLRPALKYPTTCDQERRFLALGWPSATACNLWTLWGNPSFLTPSERRSLDALEPFDEWEEFATFGCHYVLLEASNTSTSQFSESATISTEPIRNYRALRNTEFLHSEYLDTHGYRRFAAALPIKSSNSALSLICNFAGMGLATRTNSYDVFAKDNLGDATSPSTTSDTPQSRMCHTITALGDTESLLVGGRTSPAKGLVDCWLYDKSLDVWERVDDLPQARYRHGAVHLGFGRVLVSSGRQDSQNIAEEYLIWSRRTGWISCSPGIGETPVATYGGTIILSDEQAAFPLLEPRHGMVIGGLTGDGLIQQSCWQWEVQGIDTQVLP